MRRIIIFLLTLVVSSACLANKTDVESLQALLAKTKSLKAHFDQRVSKSGQVQEFRGTVLISKPHKFRWTIDFPDKQVIVADGKKIWVYDADLEQVTVQPVKNQVSELPALLLSGDTTILKKDYEVTKVSGNQENLYELSSKTEDQLIQTIRLQFDGDFALSSMTMTDGIGQKTELRFSKVETNVFIAPVEFTFKAPEGVDVIGDAN